MSDDEQTLAADEATLAELQRLAAAAREAAENPQPNEAPTIMGGDSLPDVRKLAAKARVNAVVPDEDMTVVGDSATAEQIRTLAAEARRAAKDGAAADLALDADATVVGDGDMAEEIRRIAAEARAQAAEAADDGATVVASGDMAEEIKRIAAAARAEATGFSDEGATEEPTAFDDPGEGHTMMVDADVLAEIRRSTAEAQGGQSLDAAAPPDEAHLVGLDPPEMPQPEVPDLPPPSTAYVPQAPKTDRLSDLSNLPVPEPGVQPTAATRNGGTWAPPERMVMPSEPERVINERNGPWKVVAVALALTLVVIIALLALGVIGGADPAPTEDGETTEEDQPAAEADE